MAEAPDFTIPAAPKPIPGLPSNFRLLRFSGYDGLNTKPTRPAIKDQECFILDNFMPLGKNNARTLYDAGASIVHIDSSTGGLVPGPPPTCLLGIATEADDCIMTELGEDIFPE